MVIAPALSGVVGVHGFFPQGGGKLLHGHFAARLRFLPDRFLTTASLGLLADAVVDGNMLLQ